VIPTSAIVAPREEDAGYMRSRYAIPQAAVVVMYAGRLAREKNLELLFRAFARVRQSIPSVHLFLAGGGPWEAAAGGGGGAPPPRAGTGVRQQVAVQWLDA
jgi:glycosyltransferase involved in cell wall biosynthesis